MLRGKRYHLKIKGHNPKVLSESGSFLRWLLFNFPLSTCHIWKYRAYLHVYLLTNSSTNNIRTVQEGAWKKKKTHHNPPTILTCEYCCFSLYWQAFGESEKFNNLYKVTEQLKMSETPLALCVLYKEIWQAMFWSQTETNWCGI